MTPVNHHHEHTILSINIYSIQYSQSRGFLKNSPWRCCSKMSPSRRKPVFELSIVNKRYRQAGELSRLLRCFFHDIDQHNTSKSYLRIYDCSTTGYVPVKRDQRFFYESVLKTELSWRNMWVKLPAQHSTICASSENSGNYWRRSPAKRHSLHLFLDYYNCLLYSIGETQLNRLQSVLHASQTQIWLDLCRCTRRTSLASCEAKNRVQD